MPKPVRPVRTHKSQRQKNPLKSQSPLESTLELIEGFGTRIRQAREAQGLSHEDLGRRIKEKISVLRKLESQKMTPDNKLAEKLQHTLKIKLFVPKTEEKLPRKLPAATSPKAITLGDLIQNKGKSSEATK